MPPLRSDGRASKACDSCRRLKTRCFAANDGTHTCLRCQTLNIICSLEASGSVLDSRNKLRSVTRDGNGVSKRLSHSTARPVDERLDRLEQLVGSMVDRFDSLIERTPIVQQQAQQRSETPQSTDRAIDTVSASGGADHQAPVLLIRDVATDNGVHSPELMVTSPVHDSDILLKGLLTMRDTYNLLSLFHLHYGRWVRFDETLSTEQLMLQVRKSALLFCSICLIAVRHTEQGLATKLAPVLFEEVNQLLLASLLKVPQSLDFFQSLLILSMWSTTIGQTPLSIDSWLLTSYAIPQALTSPDLSVIVRAETSRLSNHKSEFDAACIWIHICLAHLQYCVGTRRKSLIDRAQIESCTRLLDSQHLTNFEARMVAETKLYWIMYYHCCGSQINLSELKAELREWRDNWLDLLDQPRSQFLRMSFNVALLLAHCQLLQTPVAAMRNSFLNDMLGYCKEIISLAIDNRDERTRHLTDHIYHNITFAAITLCRLLHKYEAQIGRDKVSFFDDLVLQLISWLRSIGLPCHAAHLLGDILAVEHAKLRPYSYTQARVSAGEGSLIESQVRPNANALSDINQTYGNQRTELTAHMQQNFGNGTVVDFAYADPSWAGMLDLTADSDLWPQWDEFVQSSGNMFGYEESL